MQMAVWSLFNQGNEWLNPDYYASLSFYDQIQELLAIYIKLFAFGYNFDLIWQSEIFYELVGNMRATFNSDQLSVVERNLGENWYNSLIVLQSIPGNNCESIGASVGIVLRRTF